VNGPAQAPGQEGNCYKNSFGLGGRTEIHPMEQLEDEEAFRGLLSGVAWSPPWRPWSQATGIQSKTYHAKCNLMGRGKEGEREARL